MSPPAPFSFCTGPNKLWTQCWVPVSGKNCTYATLLDFPWKPSFLVFTVIESMIFFLWSWSHNEYTHSEQLFPHCYRQIVVNQYYLENFCDQLCTKQETRECNWQTCPINCLLGDYGPWSDCDPCVEKQVGDMWVYSGSRNHSKILEFPDRLNSHRNAEFLQYLKMNCPSFHCRKIPFSNMLGGKEDSFCMVSCHVNTKNNVLPPRIGIALAQLWIPLPVPSESSQSKNKC